MSHFGVDRQSVHLETECHSSKLSQQTVCWVDASFGSKCRVVGLSVDGSSRHHQGCMRQSRTSCLQNWLYKQKSLGLIQRCNGVFYDSEDSTILINFGRSFFFMLPDPHVKLNQKLIFQFLQPQSSLQANFTQIWKILFHKIICLCNNFHENMKMKIFVSTVPKG
jgi:hypothetical protein